MRADVPIPRHRREGKLILWNLLRSTIHGGALERTSESTTRNGEVYTEIADGASAASGIKSDPFVFPDEEVLTLLDKYGGRMWQQDVIAETGYSAAKVSELLGDMEADGQITRYWKNGQKVVAYPNLGPTSISA